MIEITITFHCDDCRDEVRHLIRPEDLCPECKQMVEEFIYQFRNHDTEPVCEDCYATNYETPADEHYGRRFK